MNRNEKRVIWWPTTGQFAVKSYVDKNCDHDGSRKKGGSKLKRGHFQDPISLQEVVFWTLNSHDIVAKNVYFLGQ